MTPGCGVIAPLGSISETVAAVCVHIFGGSAQRKPFAELVLPKGGRVYQGKGTGLESEVNVVFLSGSKYRNLALEVNGTGAGVILCALKDGALLPVIYGNGLQVVQTETAKVHDAVLGVPHLKAIVEHSHMLASQRTDIHALEAPDSAIILDLGSGKIADGIGHGKGGEPFHLPSG